MKKYLVDHKKKIDLLKDYDPDEYGGWKGKKDEGVKRLEKLRRELDQLQELLYAEHKQKILDRAAGDGYCRERQYHSQCF